MGGLRRPLLVVSSAAVVVWAGALVYLSLEREGSPTVRPAASSVQSSPPHNSFRGSKLPQGLVGSRAPEIRLTDARGRAMDTRRLRGRPYVVTFLYTDCKDTCPMIAAELRRALELLGPRSRDAAVVAVSAKPETDTPANVRRWLAERRMPDNFHYGLGERRRLERVWESYYAAPQGTERQPHSSSMWLVDDEGRIRTKFSAGVPVPPGDIAHDLGLLIDEASRS